MTALLGCVRASARPAIVGLGLSEMGKVYGRSTTELAVEAVGRALRDAGLMGSEVDGLLINPGISGGLDVRMHRALGLGDVRMLSTVQSYGASAVAMVQQASTAILAQDADVVVCVFADAPLTPGKSSGGAYAGAALSPAQFFRNAGGNIGPTQRYAFAARRHMEHFGTTVDDFAAVALAQRAWAEMNPLAQLRSPLDMDAYLNSPVIADPLRKFDCCLVSNGAVAIIVTSAERAASLAQPAVHVHGWAQQHQNYATRADAERFGLHTGAVESGRRALAMAQVGIGDVTFAELYDCYTYTVLVTLEDYGFCAKGEAGDLIRSGATRPGGSLPVNTGGGQLSSYYMWGMTPLSEAVIQVRGQGGRRQVEHRDLCLVSGNGGALDLHGTLLLSPHPWEGR